MMIVISFDGLSLISVISEPMSLSISSLTILMTMCPGFRPLRTSSPTALSLTDLTNDLTTLKLTSASRSALLTSFIASLTSSSVSTPLLLSFLNTFCSLSDKLSNAIDILPSDINYRVHAAPLCKSWGGSAIHHYLSSEIFEYLI